MAAPDRIFTDGFDKYAPDGVSEALLESLIIVGEWTSFPSNNNDVNPTIIPALTGDGGALQLNVSTGSSVLCGILKNFGVTYQRALGGVWINPGGFPRQENVVAFYSGTTVQLVIDVTTAGQLQVRRGDTGTGTVIVTSTDVMSASTPHYIAWDITFSATVGILKVWLDNVLTSINLTGQNTSANFNGVGHRLRNDDTFAWDHVYHWLYLAGGGSETPALDSPVIETQQVAADATPLNFTVGPAQIGDNYTLAGASNSPGANQLVLRRFTPLMSGTVDSISAAPATTSATVKTKGVIYADSAGSPAALLSSGTEVVGTTANTQLTLPLVTPQAVVAGTYYWVGYIIDTSIAMYVVDTSAVGQRAANTYTSGAPAVAPAMTTGQSSWAIWGNMSGVTAHFPQLRKSPPQITTSNNQDTAVGNVDAFEFEPLSLPSANVYCIGLKAFGYKTNSGSRTISLETDSGGTISAGSDPSITPTTSPGYMSSYFFYDPNTGTPFTPATLDAALGRIKALT